MDTDTIVSIAKTWYTEQRGRVNGNTRSWDELELFERINITDAVQETLEYMEEARQWKKGETS
jgi:hypothetical protein